MHLIWAAIKCDSFFFFFFRDLATTFMFFILFRNFLFTFSCCILHHQFSSCFTDSISFHILNPLMYITLHFCLNSPPDDESTCCFFFIYLWHRWNVETCTKTFTYWSCWPNDFTSSVVHIKEGVFCSEIIYKGYGFILMIFIQGTCWYNYWVID